jgi:hypothetical protein
MKKKIGSSQVNVEFFYTLVLLCIVIFSRNLQAQIKPSYLQEKERIIIFCYGSQKADWIAKKIESELEGKFDIIEKTKVEEILKRNRLQWKDLQSIQTFIKIGRETAADKGILVATEEGHKNGEYWWRISRYEFYNIKSGSCIRSMASPTMDMDEVISDIREITSWEARIIAKEKDNVTFDIGSESGVREGRRFDVFIDNEKVGLIEVNEVQDKFSNAKIKRGSSKIKVGASVKEKIYTSLWGISISQSFFPIKAIVNEEYERVTGERTQRINSGSVIHLGYYKICTDGLSPNGGVGALELGLMSIGDKHPIQICLNGFANKEVVAELLDIYIGLGGFIVPTITQNWAVEGNLYSGDIQLGNHGTCDAVGLGFQMFGGLILHPYPHLNIFGDLCYISCHPKEWSMWKDLNDNGNVDEGEEFRINPEWRQYEDIKIGGLSTRIGISLWF